MRSTINQLPQQSGEYILTISRFNEEPIEKRVQYNYNEGVWLDINSGSFDKALTSQYEVLGNSDKVIHEGEYWNIHSFRNPDQFDLN